MAIGLNIAIEQSGGVHILKLEGRVDAITTPALEREVSNLYDAGHTKVLLDFSRVDYLSSAGMRLLLSSTKKFKGKGGGFALCEVAEDVMELLSMAGFDKILSIFRTEEDAIKVMG